MSVKVYIGIAAFFSTEQICSLELRQRILRTPLNQQLEWEEINNEQAEIHIIAQNGSQIIGTLLLRKISVNTVKMRQVAVDEDYQKLGIGVKLVNFSENWCLENGFSVIELNARNTAMQFYLNQKYTISGLEFYEVGIPHHKMYKVLK